MSVYQDASGLVKEKWEMAQDFTIESYRTAMEALGKLSEIGRQLELLRRTINIDTTTISTSIDDLIPPTINEEDLRFDYPNEPQEPPLVNTDMKPLPDFPHLVLDTIPSPSDQYISPLLSALQNKLLRDLQNGTTGLSPDVENAIFYREYERSLLTHQDAMDRIASEWSKRGFPLPDGALQAAFMEEEINFTNKRLDLSRDIAIKSFELAFQNTQFVIQQSISIQQMLLQWANWVADRTVAVAKAIIDAQIESYKARVAGISEQYRAIIEEVKAKIEHNAGLIRMYTARVEAYASKIRAETARIEGTVRGYEGKINLFRSLVGFEAEKVGLNLKVLDAKINQAVANANILIKDKEIEMKNYEAINSLKMEAMKGGASIAAQLVAGAMSSVSAGAQLSASSNFTRSESYQKEESRRVIIQED